jgi:hypothetical protein
MFRSATTFLLLGLRGLTLSSLRRLFKYSSVLLKSFESNSIGVPSDYLVRNWLLWCVNANKCNPFDLNDFGQPLQLMYSQYM